MEPLTIITTALITGAAMASKDVAAQAVKDAYTGLRTLILRKFGTQKEVKPAIEGVEKRPESKSRQGVLKEELELAEVAKDTQIVEQAQALLALLEQQDEGGAKYQADLKGSGAIAQGKGATAAGERGIAVSGSVGGSISTGSGNITGDLHDEDD
jgi:hypothetical protein